MSPVREIAVVIFYSTEHLSLWGSLAGEPRYVTESPDYLADACSISAASGPKRVNRYDTLAHRDERF